MHKWIAVLSLLGSLLLVNYAVFNKEQHLANGVSVFVKLAPVDPRSIMQGDYMVLRFELADNIRQVLAAQGADEHDLAAQDGRVIVQIDDKQVASFVALDHGQPLAANQQRLHYRLRDKQVKFATNSYFFEEGLAEVYASAQYAEFKVNSAGELLLSALHDQQLKRLGPALVTP